MTFPCMRRPMPLRPRASVAGQIRGLIPMPSASQSPSRRGQRLDRMTGTSRTLTRKLIGTNLIGTARTPTRTTDATMGMDMIGQAQVPPLPHQYTMTTAPTHTTITTTQWTMCPTAQLQVGGRLAVNDPRTMTSTYTASCSAPNSALSAYTFTFIRSRRNDRLCNCHPVFSQPRSLPAVSNLSHLPLGLLQTEIRNENPVQARGLVAVHET